MTLLLEQDMPEPVAAPFGAGRLAYFSARLADRAGPNEDGALFDEAGVLAVADGAGGQAAGAKASRCALERLRDSLAGAASLRDGIMSGFEQAQEGVAALGIGAATTLAVVELSEGAVRSYHVGDSFILVVGQRGRRKLQSISHSPVGYAVEAGLLDEEEALHHDERHLVSNLLGAPGMRVEVTSPLRLAPRDTVVLASDGLTDNLHVEEVVEIVRRGPLDKAARRLAATAAQRMRTPEPEQPSKPDDLTFLLYRGT
jgi:serine/threonine protein phosphatase PrpC